MFIKFSIDKYSFRDSKVMIFFREKEHAEMLWWKKSAGHRDVLLVGKSSQELKLLAIL